MANMCSNFVSFAGRKANISELKMALEAAIDIQENNGVGIGNLIPTNYFFDMMISDSTDTSVEFSYETKWSPNIEDLADVCKEYGVTATCEYQEDGMDIRGTTIYNADGTYMDIPMEQKFLELVTYSIDDDIFTYTPTGEQGDCRDDLIEKWYPKWKAEQSKVIMGQMTETEFFNDKKGGNDENN